MTLHFHWPAAPRWFARGHADRAMAFVLGIIGVSLLFGALRVVDAAVSGAVGPRRAALSMPVASGATADPAVLLEDSPASTGTPVDASLDVPQATVDAISL